MWIEVFSAGNVKDSSGREHSFSPADLDLIATKYNAGLAESAANSAPLVKGHPSSDAPAHGWVERLARRGNKLVARLTALSPEIIGEINAGRFKKVSVSLFPDLKLRHIGLLGAATPAVRNLAPLAFSEGECLTFSEDFALEQDNLEATDEATLLRNKNRELSERIMILEKESRLKGYREFAQKLINSEQGSTLTPAQAPLLIDILESAYETDSARENYTENNGPVLADRIMEFMSGLRPVFSPSELKMRLTGITEAPGFDESNVNTDRLKLHKRALEIRDLIPGISYEEAV